MNEERPAWPLLLLSYHTAEPPEPLWEADDVAVERVSVDALLPADSPRLHGQDDEHIRRLANSDAPLPPIIVHRSTMRVIDGMHRLGAARASGNALIDVRFFDGSATDAFALGVQSNVAHGLPLTRADRIAAATRIIAEHPSWSDRLIASVSGLSAGVVSTLRRESGAAEIAARVGRDGRRRPVDAVTGRLAASRIISERPDASLREVAREAGISPMTARDVRERLQRGEDPIPLHRRGQTRPSSRPDCGSPPPEAGCPDGKPDIASVLDNLIRDPTLRFTDSGRKLLRWLTRLSVSLPMWNDVTPTVPQHSTYMVAALARQCADEWRSFADELTKRTDSAR